MGRKLNLDILFFPFSWVFQAHSQRLSLWQNLLLSCWRSREQSGFVSDPADTDYSLRKTSSPWNRFLLKFLVNSHLQTWSWTFWGKILFLLPISWANWWQSQKHLRASASSAAKWGSMHLTHRWSSAWNKHQFEWEWERRVLSWNLKYKLVIIGRWINATRFNILESCYWLMGLTHAEFARQDTFLHLISSDRLFKANGNVPLFIPFIAISISEVFFFFPGLGTGVSSEDPQSSKAWTPQRCSEPYHRPDGNWLESELFG